MIEASVGLSVPEQRAERLKRVRAMAGFSREQFAQAAGISPTTVSFWENVTHKGLSDAGARKTVAAVAKAGVICTTLWLLHGVGDSPYFAEAQWDNKQKDESSSLILTNYREELALFNKRPNAVTVELSDNSMEPFFSKGDVVGGFWQHIQNITLAPNKFYIISHHDKLLLRRIGATSHADHYNLYATSFADGPHQPFEIVDVKLEKIAPVIRLWRQ